MNLSGDNIILKPSAVGPSNDADLEIQEIAENYDIDYEVLRNKEFTIRGKGYRIAGKNLQCSRYWILLEKMGQNRTSYYKSTQSVLFYIRSLIHD